MGATVLVIGSGGREHALAWKLSQSPQVSRIIAAPGNDGFSKDWERWDIKLEKAQFKTLAARAKEARVDLVVVGPDNPLADGLVDVLEAEGLLAFGPTAGAAKIEASKAFAKEVMESAGVPTAKFEVVRSETEARRFLTSVDWGSGWVVKADGLALGKGVRVCDSREEALEAASELIRVSGQLVIEERLQGEELSWMAFCDGERCALLEPARDYKRVGDGDSGPNTGGMGAFSPVPGVTDALAERVRSEVFLPTLREMKKRGVPFRGVLYAGLMIDLVQEKYWVLEFNARFGDPETQVLMPRIQDDFYKWCRAVAEGDISRLPGQVPFGRDHAVVVVGAARGYPDAPEKGQKISTADGFRAPDYFCAGVSQNGRDLVSAGGRVLGAVGTGPHLESARSEAYRRIRDVNFSGMHFRTDIGQVRRHDHS